MAPRRLVPASSMRKVKSHLSKAIRINRVGVCHQVGPSSSSAPPIHLGVEQERIPQGKLGESWERWDEKRQDYNSELTSATRRALNQVTQDENHGSQPPDHDMDVDEWEDIINTMNDEGPSDNLDISHQGGDYDAVCEYIHVLKPRNRKRVDRRQWAERIHRLELAWDTQMPALTDAYLSWKHGAKEIPENDEKFSIHVIGLDVYHENHLYDHITGSQYLNVTLLCHGLLSPSPTYPSLAFTVPTLELFRRLQLRSPNISVQAWVRALCDIHNVNYRCHLRQQFSQTFDVYLGILRRMQQQIDTLMGHDAPDWHLKNACPSCLFKLENEATLVPSMLIAFDGNNSLKQLYRPDRMEFKKEFSSSYYLSREEVDRFKNEVRKQTSANKTSGTHQDGVFECASEDGEPVNGADQPMTCTDCWKAANADTARMSVKEFEETGIFLSACRHGFVLLLADMVRSGELAKYPLAHLDKLMSAYGKNLAIGYDIACSFSTMVRNSTLGLQAQKLQVRFIVQAFYGYAHNRQCQLDWHPLYAKGFGIEDLEVCERVFKGSNSLASGVRHATYYHRKQAIDMYFRQHDEDKYELLSTFIYNNYMQALNLLHDMSLAIEAITAGRNISETTYQKWLNEERKYLASRKAEPEMDATRSEYVMLLMKMQDAKNTFDTACSMTEPPSVIDKMSRMHRVTAIRQNAWEAYEFLQKEVMRIEDILDIAQRWTLENQEWQDAMKYIQIQEFQLAVDKLEGLVVQWLFELTKANLSGTGYKLHIHISKALEKRCKAICTALKRYNTAAGALDPPRPRLGWQEVIEYGSIAEFELLRVAGCEDICNMEWTDPVNRQVTIYLLKMEHAKEEIARLNVEVARLNTFISESESKMSQILQEVEASHGILGGELREQFNRHKRLNNIHRQKLAKIFNLTGFTGSREVGIRAGDQPNLTIHIPRYDHAKDKQPVSSEPESSDEVDDDEDCAEMDHLQSFIQNLTIDDE